LQPADHATARGLRAIAAALVVLLFSACSALPTDVQRTPSYALEDTSDSQLVRNLEPLLQQHPDLSGFRTLIEGEDAFAARLKIIREAQRSIDAQYYIWHNDLTGRVLQNRLLHAADRGVRVRILLDDLDTAGKDDILRKLDAHPNLEVRLFNPFARRDRRSLDFLTDTRRVNHRMHNKTLTADSIATIFGGRNIGDEYFAAATEVGFGDMDALAVGPIAKEVSSQFDLYWNSELVYPLAAFDWDAPVDQAAVAEFRRQSDAHIQQAADSEYADVIRQFATIQVDTIADLDFVWSEWVLVYDQPDKINIEEITAGTHLAPRLVSGMDKTQTDLIIVSPYFVPGDELTAFLTGLVLRGVRVRILTNSLQANDVSLVHAGYMRYREDLVAGGVELYEYKAEANKVRRQEEKKRNKDRSYIGASRASLHAKFFAFDGEYLFIGSFNLDPRSVRINTELGAYYRSPDGASTLSEIFDERAIRIGYRVELDESGDIEWVTLKDERELRLDKEPDTTAWKRFSTRVLSTFVPESQL
jgi:putative cardiolipin synthase